MNRALLAAIVLIPAIVCGAFLTQLVEIPGLGRGSHTQRAPYLVTNEAYIDGLYTELNLKDPIEVFGYFFARLPKTVNVYPSENYCYFVFTAAGRQVVGSLTLYPAERDKGVVGFGYVAKIDDKRRQKFFPMKGGSHDFGPSDGLALKRLDDWHYEAAYQGRTVVFALYNDSAFRRTSTRLMASETVVGPSFDESGLRFLLVFNNASKALYWILNEDGFVPEAFERYTDDIVVGARTRYAFFQDTVLGRKVMIGVDGFNVLQNNWYDGPFDQMPDNQVLAGGVHVKRYLLAAYRLEEDMIDSLGQYEHSHGSMRLPVASYMVYFNRRQLLFADSCAAHIRSRDSLYAVITEQKYDVPRKYDY